MAKTQDQEVNIYHLDASTGWAKTSLFAVNFLQTDCNGTKQTSCVARTLYTNYTLGNNEL